MHVKAWVNMLVKSTPGVNFINILCMNFLYERQFGSFFSSYLYVTCTWKKVAETTFVRKKLKV